MTEAEYILVTNRVKISLAKEAMMHTMAGDDYGLTVGQRTKVLSILTNSEDKIFKMIDDMQLVTE